MYSKDPETAREGRRRGERDVDMRMRDKVDRLCSQGQPVIKEMRDGSDPQRVRGFDYGVSHCCYFVDIQF
ncbi:hypothetical protein HS088_TW17G00391 [Tripterygium wilfordii]|uniref:Uncharacterized protein n=1 Tax=Tripterygium wilfordii TaxID=458696 RepID=A0A7J7CFD1_TRIWF|nr:hypothetical protein HS088_TW17G00391 [Tripterygium wilfordii]